MVVSLHVGQRQRARWGHSKSPVLAALSSLRLLITGESCLYSPYGFATTSALSLRSPVLLERTHFPLVLCRVRAVPQEPSPPQWGPHRALNVLPGLFTLRSLYLPGFHKLHPPICSSTIGSIQYLDPALGTSGAALPSMMRRCKMARRYPTTN